MYRSEVIAEIVKQNSMFTGRGPKPWEYIMFHWDIRNWTYEELLNGLVAMNVRIAYWGVQDLVKIRNKVQRFGAK